MTGGWFIIVLPTLIILIYDHDTSDNVRDFFQEKMLLNCDNPTTPSEEIITWISLSLHAPNGQQPCLPPWTCLLWTQFTMYIYICIYYIYTHSNPQKDCKTIHHCFSRILLFYPSFRACDTQQWWAPVGAMAAGKLAHRVRCSGEDHGRLTHRGFGVYVIYIWVNYNNLTVTSLESWLVREIIPKCP